MKIVVMGTGGVGGYFGARLSKAGNDVGFIARGAHLKAIKEKGLKVLSELGEININSLIASDNPSDFEIPEIILFCVKTYDMEVSTNLIKPIVGSGTVVIPLLNGISHFEIMKNILGEDKVIGGIASISALIEEPGVIRHNSTMQMLKFAEFDKTITSRIKNFQNTCNKAGINNSIPENIEIDLWQKFILICTLAGANCLTRLPLGLCRKNSATLNLMKEIATEVITIAHAENVPLPSNQLEIIMDQLYKLPDGMKASTLPALENGEKLEISALHGTILKFGEKNNIDTPMNRAVFAALSPHENGKYS